MEMPKNGKFIRIVIIGILGVSVAVAGWTFTEVRDIPAEYLKNTIFTQHEILQATKFDSIRQDIAKTANDLRREAREQTNRIEKKIDILYKYLLEKDK